VFLKAELSLYLQWSYVDDSLEQEHFTCPTILTSGFWCRTCGIFDICNAFFYFYHALRWTGL